PAARSRFFGVVDGHGAAQNVQDADVLPAEVAHFGGHGLLGGIVFEGFEDIGVGRAVAAEDFAENGQETFQVGEVKCSPERILGFAEFQGQDLSAGFGDAQHIAQALVEVGEIAQAVTYGQEVEGVCGKRNLLGVTTKKFDFEVQVLDTFCAGTEAISLLFGDFEHGRAEVEADDVHALPRQGEGDVAGAAAKVEGALAGARSSEAEQTAFPGAMQAEALDIVNQVITAGDGGEEFTDLGGALFTGFVKMAGHRGFSNIASQWPKMSTRSDKNSLL